MSDASKLFPLFAVCVALAMSPAVAVFMVFNVAGGDSTFGTVDYVKEAGFRARRFSRIHRQSRYGR
jgi:hypothetical protein